LILTDRLFTHDLLTFEPSDIIRAIASSARIAVLSAPSSGAIPQIRAGVRSNCAAGRAASAPGRIARSDALRGCRFF
jgi:hypothetical protein